MHSEGCMTVHPLVPYPPGSRSKIFTKSFKILKYPGFLSFHTRNITNYYISENFRSQLFSLFSGNLENNKKIFSFFFHFKSLTKIEKQLQLIFMAKHNSNCYAKYIKWLGMHNSLLRVYDKKTQKELVSRR